MSFKETVFQQFYRHRRLAGLAGVACLAGPGEKNSFLYSVFPANFDITPFKAL